MGARCEQVLAVVEHDKDSAPLQLVDQGLCTARPRTRLHTERLGHDVGHEQRFTDRRQIDEPHPVGVRLTDPPRGLQRQSRLTAAPRSGQRDQARATDQSLHVGEFTLPSDETGQRPGEVPDVGFPAGMTAGLPARRPPVRYRR